MEEIDLTRDDPQKNNRKEISEEAAVRALLRIIGYKGENNFKTIGDVYRSRDMFTIIELIKLDNVRWLSSEYTRKEVGNA